jgi:hypothetical protein
LAATPLQPPTNVEKVDPTALPEGLVRGDTCTHPIALNTPVPGTAPAVLEGDLSRFVGDFNPTEGSGASRWQGRDAVYRIDLRRADSLLISLEGTPGTRLFAFRNCGQPEQSVLWSLEPGKPAVVHTADEDGPVWLAVDAEGDYTAAGTYKLSIQSAAPMGSPASGPDGAGNSGGSDRCEVGPRVTPGRRVQGNLRGAMTQVTEPFAGSSMAWPGPDHFLSLTVRKGFTYGIEVDDHGLFKAGLYLLDDCANVTGKPLAEGAGGVGSIVTWTSDREGTVALGIDSAEAGVGSVYDVAVLEVAADGTVTGAAPAATAPRTPPPPIPARPGDLPAPEPPVEGSGAGR